MEKVHVKMYIKRSMLKNLHWKSHVIKCKLFEIGATNEEIHEEFTSKWFILNFLGGEATSIDYPVRPPDMVVRSLSAFCFSMHLFVFLIILLHNNLDYDFIMNKIT